MAARTEGEWTAIFGNDIKCALNKSLQRFKTDSE